MPILKKQWARAGKTVWQIKMCAKSKYQYNIAAAQKKYQGANTMSDIPVQVIVAAFQDENTANAALNELKEAKKKGLIDIRDAAVLTKDAQGKLHIKDTKDWGFGKGAMAGGVVGVIAGLLAGPVGWGLLGGALIGGVAAKMADGGFDNKRLQQIGASLKPGSSAIVAVVDHVWVAQAEAIMQKQALDATTQAISDDVAKQLEEGRDV
ncbi:MAG: hypothetical protein DCC52_11330, partial [Chloroflexi bacterium]